MIQLAFDASTPEEALARGPTRIAYAQHGGGETAGTTGSSRRRPRTRWSTSLRGPTRASTSRLSTSGAAGRAQGLDATTREASPTSSGLRRPLFRPSRRREQARVAELPWPLRPEGRKASQAGSRAPARSASGRGPSPGWKTCAARRRRCRFPEGPGATVTDFSATQSRASPGPRTFWGTGSGSSAISLGLVAITVVPLRRAAVAPSRPYSPTKERPRASCLVAWILYRQHALTLLSVALVIVLLSIGIARLLQLISQIHVHGDRLHARRPRARQPLRRLLRFARVPAGARPRRRPDRGRPSTHRRRRASDAVGRVPGGRPAPAAPPVVEVLGVLAMVGLALTLIGIPYAIKKAVDWTFAGQEVVFRRCKAREALSGSAQRVRGRWWAIAGVNVAIFFLGAMLAPLIAAFPIMSPTSRSGRSTLSAWPSSASPSAYMVTTLTLLYLEPANSRSRQRAPGGNGSAAALNGSRLGELVPPFSGAW